jgi:hypothetical protein
MIRGMLISILIVLLGTSAAANDKRYDVPLGDSPQRGPENAPVTIIEFLDFQ